MRSSPPLRAFHKWLPSKGGCGGTGSCTARGLRPGVLGPRRSLHVHRHRRGIGRRVLRDGGARALGRRAAGCTSIAVRTRPSTCSKDRWSSSWATTRSRPVPVTSSIFPAASSTASRTRAGNGARSILTFTPAGIERFFEATLERAPNTVDEIPDNVEEVGAPLRRRSRGLRARVRLTRASGGNPSQLGASGEEQTRTTRPEPASRAVEGTAATTPARPSSRAAPTCHRSRKCRWSSSVPPPVWLGLYRAVLGTGSY